MNHRIVKKTGKTGWAALAVVAIMALAWAAPAGAAVQVVDGFYTTDLIAGQNIVAGEVVVEIVDTDIVVTYTTESGWELAEAHLWAGTSLSQMPQTKKGNPRIGNFPYASGDITGETAYTMAIPMASVASEAFLCGPDGTLFFAAHAVVRQMVPGGTYQTETAWGSGNGFVERGSWATYFTVQFTCAEEPPPPPATCETAFGFGDKKLWDILDTSGDPITTRWGWQITVRPFQDQVVPIYAGAGQNDPSKGYHVGDLFITYDGESLNVTFDLFSSFDLEETHIYAGSTETQTAAPGQFGYLHESLSGADSDSYTIAVTGEPVYVVAHAVVCIAPE